MSADADRDVPADDEPEFGTSRRRFLIAMFMLGAIPPERVVERVVDEIQDENP